MTEPYAQPYAGIVSRGVAFVMDAVVVATVTQATMAFVVLIGLVTTLRPADLAGVVLRMPITMAPLLFAVYQAAFWGLTGRTPGMALLGLRVTGTRGGPVSWAAATIRALVLTLFPIGALWCFVDRRHQAVHDKLARTVVVRATVPVTRPAVSRRYP